MAEENPFDPDEIVVAEQWGSDVVLINRKTRKLRTLFGERGVPGDGERINLAHSAHFIPSGRYEGQVLITEFEGRTPGDDHRQRARWGPVVLLRLQTTS